MLKFNVVGAVLDMFGDLDESVLTSIGELAKYGPFLFREQVLVFIESRGITPQHAEIQRRRDYSVESPA